MFGLRKLADSLSSTGGKIPGWALTALEKAEEADTLQHLVEDACSGVYLTLRIPSFTVRIWFIPIRFPGADIVIRGNRRGEENGHE
jgi:hypothetical protein